MGKEQLEGLLGVVEKAMNIANDIAFIIRFPVGAGLADSGVAVSVCYGLCEFVMGCVTLCKLALDCVSFLSRICLAIANNGCGDCQNNTAGSGQNYF